MKWEYKRDDLGWSNAPILGLQGWELCASSPGFLYYKRPLIEKPLVKEKPDSKIRKGDWIICNKWKPNIWSEKDNSYRVFSVDGDNVRILVDDKEYKFHTYSITGDNIRKIKFNTPGFHFNK